MLQEDSSSTLNQNLYEDEGDVSAPPLQIPNKRHTRINIFEAVLEQEAEY